MVDCQVGVQLPCRFTAAVQVRTRSETGQTTRTLKGENVFGQKLRVQLLDSLTLQLPAFCLISHKAAVWIQLFLMFQPFTS